MIRALLTTRHPLLAKEITVGHIDLSNDETSTEILSNHDVQVYRRAKGKPEAELFRTGRLENFNRGEFSYYDMLHQALNALAEDGYSEASQLRPVVKVTVSVIPSGTGTPRLQGFIQIERQKGGSNTAARFKIDLFATDDRDSNFKVFRSGQLRDFDTTQNGYFDLLQACLNACVKDGFFRRSQSTHAART